MTADRYEITVTDILARVEYPNGCAADFFADGSARDRFAFAAIRQQARDLDQLRADLAAAVAERDELRAERGDILTQRFEAVARAEQAEARLAAIDNAPTVAVVCSSHSFGQFVQQRFFGSQLPRIGTELIARPAKD